MTYLYQNVGHFLMIELRTYIFYHFPKYATISSLTHIVVESTDDDKNDRENACERKYHL